MDNSQNIQITEKRQRGRPKKILTPDEILALQNKTKRPRGRPKKEWTLEELAIIEKKEKRERGRPHKILSPQEEWILKYAPKKQGKGRPNKNAVLHICLPKVIARLAIDNPKIEKKLEIIEEKMEDISRDFEKENEKKIIPEMTWKEFKEKINIAELPDELPENYIFPSIDEEKNNEEGDKIYIRSVRSNTPSFKNTPIREDKIEFGREPTEEQIRYLWEEQAEPSARQKHAREILGFDIPEEVNGAELRADFKKIDKSKKKNKQFKVNLIEQDFVKEYPIIKNEKQNNGFFYYVFDLPLIQFGKILYFGWKIITAPFKFLDFVVDRSLKGVWFGIVFIFKQIYKIFNINILYVFGLFKKRSVLPVLKNSSTKKYSFKPLASFMLTAVILVLPFIVLNGIQEAKKTKGDVLGVSESGMNYLKEAAGNLSENDMVGAIDNFGRAESSFFIAQKQISELGPIVSSIIKIIPQARDGEKILRAGEYLSKSAVNISKAISIFDTKEISLTEKISFLGNA
jgi:hypothetical protein